MGQLLQTTDEAFRWVISALTENYAILNKYSHCWCYCVFDYPICPNKHTGVKPLKISIHSIENSVDPDQLASHEAS